MYQCPIVTSTSKLSESQFIMYEPSLLNIHQIATNFSCYTTSEIFLFSFPCSCSAPVSKRRRLGRISHFALQGGITCQLQLPISLFLKELPPYFNSVTSFQGPS